MKRRKLLACLAVCLSLSACAVPFEDAERRGVVKRLYASTVQILVRQADGVRRAGSGVVLWVDEKTGDSYIVTARHVVTHNEDQDVFVIGRFRKNSFPAHVLVLGDDDDIALIRTRGLAVKPVALGETAGLGQGVWVVSYPWGRRRTLVNGIVSQIEWPDDGRHQGEVPLEGPVRLIDASAGFGTSGGGVFDLENGALLGIVRGYRSVQLPVKGPDGRPVSLPIAGETTVVSIARIRAFLARAGYLRLLHRAVPEPTFQSFD